MGSFTVEFVEYSLCPKLSVIFGFRVTRLTQFYKKYVQYLYLQIIILLKKTRFKVFFNDTNYVT